MIYRILRKIMPGRLWHRLFASRNESRLGRNRASPLVAFTAHLLPTGPSLTTFRKRYALSPTVLILCSPIYPASRLHLLSLAWVRVHSSVIQRSERNIVSICIVLSWRRT